MYFMHIDGSKTRQNKYSFKVFFIFLIYFSEYFLYIFHIKNILKKYFWGIFFVNFGHIFIYYFSSRERLIFTADTAFFHGKWLILQMLRFSMGKLSKILSRVTQYLFLLSIIKIIKDT